MAEKYYSILTNRGKELEAQSTATGKPVIIKDFVVGDGNGQPVKPDPALTALVREVYRAAVSALQVSPEQDNQFIAQLVLPADVGGFVVREVGLLTDAGELYAVANCAAIEKPVSGISVKLQFRLAVSETADIELKVSTGDGLFLRQDANLSDVVDIVRARKNLGLKEAAVLDVGTKAGTVAAGDDARITGAVQRAGDEMAGPFVIADSTPLRFKQKNISSFFRFDGSTLYLMFTKKGDPDGGYSDLRPFYVDANSGAVTFGNSVKALAGITANSIKSNSSLFIESDDRQHIIFQNKDGTARAYIYKDRNSDLRLNNGNEGGGDFVISRTGEIFWGPNGARLSHDGNLYGSIWGGWLSNWISGQIGTRAEINWVQSNFITDVALGAEGSFIIAKNAWQRAPAGCVLTGYNAEGNEPVNDTLFYRPIQKYVPTVGWMVIGHTA
ncbi:phage tail protein [Enterobacter roggenkampii]|uniref:phage tail protein n=1 Tax=Enterobacter roggenkampii TaxID=1812935 RepID=UPI0029D7182A|nr:phage tail protein [Enterobacter roggenkampii]MDX6919070.1 phage tail protein [Enterobacter roggenkampii]